MAGKAPKNLGEVAAKVIVDIIVPLVVVAGSELIQHLFRRKRQGPDEEHEE